MRVYICTMLTGICANLYTCTYTSDIKFYCADGSLLDQEMLIQTQSQTEERTQLDIAHDGSTNRISDSPFASQKRGNYVTSGPETYHVIARNLQMVRWCSAVAATVDHSLLRTQQIAHRKLGANAGFQPLPQLLQRRECRLGRGQEEKRRRRRGHWTLRWRRGLIHVDGARRTRLTPARRWARCSPGGRWTPRWRRGLMHADGPCRTRLTPARRWART